MLSALRRMIAVPPREAGWQRRYAVMGFRLFATAQEPKQAHWIEGGGHNDLWRRNAFAAIDGFMARHF